MSAPRLSVVINTYNRAASLPATLDGLSRQVDGDFEVVVVNGPSTDGSAELLEQWSDRVRVVDLDEVHRELSALRLRTFAAPTLRDAVARPEPVTLRAAVMPMNAELSMAG